jgi:dolichol-phosphate mannosyltransferase
VLRPLLSVVLPIHNELENLEPVLNELSAVLRDVAHEIVAVDDASTDGSLAELERLAASCSDLRVIHLVRRAGQSAAFVAGFDAARGDVLATMDADGQHDPADLVKMLALLTAPDGPAAVVGYRSPRADSGWKRLQSRVANSVRDLLTADSVRDSACSVRVMRRAALVGLPRFSGMHRFLPTLIRQAGGQVLQVPVRDRPRLSGRSKYGMLDRALRGLTDALGVRWLGKRALRYTVDERKP